MVTGTGLDSEEHHHDNRRQDKPAISRAAQPAGKAASEGRIQIGLRRVVHRIHFAFTQH